MKEFFDHPINALEITDDMLENEHYKALISLQNEGSKDEQAVNFINHAKADLVQASKSVSIDIEKAWQLY